MATRIQIVAAKAKRRILVELATIEQEADVYRVRLDQLDRQGEHLKGQLSKIERTLAIKPNPRRRRARP